MCKYNALATKAAAAATAAAVLVRCTKLPPPPPTRQHRQNRSAAVIAVAIFVNVLKTMPLRIIDSTTKTSRRRQRRLHHPQQHPVTKCARQRLPLLPPLLPLPSPELQATRSVRETTSIKRSTEARHKLKARQKPTQSRISTGGNNVYQPYCLGDLPNAFDPSVHLDSANNSPITLQYLKRLKQ